MSSRKPVDRLTQEDLHAAPIWEYIISGFREGENETWVKPVRARLIPSGRYSLLVAARFVTRTDRILPGFMIVTTANREIEINPGAIVHPTYRVLPCLTIAEAKRKRAPWQIADRQRLLQALRMRAAEVFPIQYLLRAALRKSGAMLGGLVQ